MESAIAMCFANFRVALPIGVVFASLVAHDGLAQSAQGPLKATASTAANSALLTAQPTRPVQIASYCEVGPDTVFVHADFQVKLSSGTTPPELARYLKRAYRQGHGRWLWNVECSRRTLSCTGFTLDLTPADAGEPVKSTDTVNSMAGARLKAQTESFFVVEWGSYVLTVEPKSRTLTLRFDDGNLSGNGMGHCTTLLMP